MGYIAIDVTEVKTVIQMGTVEMATVPNGTKPNSGLKSLKNNRGLEILCSCILSASTMGTTKRRIVRLTFDKTHCRCSYQEVLSPSHRLTSALVTSALCWAYRSDCPPTLDTVSLGIQRGITELFFVTKLHWKLVSNCYINAYLI